MRDVCEGGGVGREMFVKGGEVGVRRGMFVKGEGARDVC